MKCFSLIVALCLALTVPAIGIESDSTSELQLYVIPIKEKTLDVTLSNLQRQSTTVAIVSLDGQATFFRDVIKNHNGYHKRLNLAQLPIGKYKLVVQQGDVKYQQVIVMKADIGMLLSGIKKHFIINIGS